MNFKVGDVICQYNGLTGIFHYETSFSEIAFCITKIEKNNPHDFKSKDILFPRDLYKFYVVIIKFRDLSENTKTVLLEYLPKSVELENLPISTYVNCYCIEGGKCILYKDNAHLNSYPSGLQFRLIKFHDRLKINGKFVFEGYNGKSVEKINYNNKIVYVNSDHPQSTAESYIIPNKYTITYYGNNPEEITLYGPDKDINYTTEPPPTLIDRAFKCVGEMCKRTNRVQPIGGSKTRKRRKFKKTHK